MPLPVMTPDEENVIVQSLGGKPGQKLRELPDGNIGIADDSGPQLVAPGAMPAAPYGQATMEAAANRGMFDDPRVKAFNAGAREAVLPTGVGAVAGHLAGRGLTALGVQNPIAAVGIPFAAGLGGTLATVAAQDAMRSKADEEMRQQLLSDPVNQRFHAVGWLAGGLPFMRPGIAPLQGTARVARNLVAGVAPVAEDIGAAVGTGLGLAAILGPAGYHALTSTNKVDPWSLGISTVGGLLMNQPNTRVGKMSGGLLPHEAYVYKPTPGQSMMRGGLESQLPLEPDLVGGENVSSPETLKAEQELAAKMANAKEKLLKQRRAEQVKQAKVQLEGQKMQAEQELAQLNEAVRRQQEQDDLAAKIADERNAVLERQRKADEQAARVANQLAVQEQRRAQGQQSELIAQGKYDEKTAYSIAKARAQRERAARQGDVKMARQQLDAAKKYNAGELGRDILAGETVQTEAGNRRADALRTRPTEAAGIAADETTLAAEKIGEYDALLDPRKGGAKIPHVPDNYDTVREQMNLALDPASGRKAVLLGKDVSGGPQTYPPLPVRMRRVSTPHGEVLYNPAKITEAEVLAAAQGTEFDARVLGLSQGTKPGEAAGVLVSGNKNAQAEVVSAEGVPAAVEAALKVDPSAAPELREPETVLEDREQPPAYSNESTASALDTAAREVAGADNLDKLRGMTARTLEGQGYDVNVMKGDKPFVTGDDPTPRFGKYQGNRVEFSTARADTPLHEAMHAMLNQLPRRGQAKLGYYVKNDPAFVKAKETRPNLTWQEHLVETGGQQTLERVQSEEFGLWNDMVSGWKRLTGSATTGDAARKLGNMMARGGGRKGGKVNIHGMEDVPNEEPQTGPTYRRYPETYGEEKPKDEDFSPGAAPKEEGSEESKSGAKYSRAEGVFSTELEKQARKGGPIWGVNPDKAGSYDAAQVVAKFRAQGKIEQEILPGFEEWAKGKGKVTAAEVIAYAKENEPKVQVHTYGMDREQSAAKKEYDKLHGEYDAMGKVPTFVPEVVGGVYRVHYYNHGGNGRDVVMEVPRAEWDRAKRFEELGQEIAREAARPDEPTATSYYNSISPRPVDRPMPEWTTTKGKRNLQRVDVVIPSANKGTVGQWAGRERPPHMSVEEYNKKVPLWQQDDLHENLPNTLGWAAIQYETGPNGERIAHVIEAQSRWGQEVRNRTQSQKDMYGDEKNHPLLRDYNRLILKSAIEQARKEGATHIAVSDAETAMLTEMHDQSATPGYLQEDLGKWYLVDANGQPARIQKWYDTSESAWESVDRQNARAKGWTVRQVTEESLKPTINQEGGMRFNYDGRKGQLHKIAQELTRSAGEDISFGEHKNAFESDVEVMSLPSGGPAKPREDLILKNPDGTPKTTATGRLYPIAEPAARRAAGEPYTYGGARYSRPIRGMSTVQRIANPALRKAVMNAYDEKQRISGQTANRVLDELRPYRKVLTPEFYDKMVRSYRGSTPVSFTFAEQQARRLINSHMTRVGTMANKMGAKRQITLTHDYVPEPISEEAIHEIKANRASKESLAIEKQLTAHFGDAALAKEYLNQIAKSDYVPDHEYGPLRKAAGKGLPKGVTVGAKYIPIREPDMIVAFERYGNRVARDLAWTREVENKGFDKAKQAEVQDEFFNLAKHEYNGNIRSDYSAVLHSGMKLASSYILGMGTGVNNLISLPQNMLRYGGSKAIVRVLEAGAKVVTEGSRLRTESVNTGHLRVGQSDMAFSAGRNGAWVPDALDKITKAMQYTGQKPTEFGSRIWTRAFGEAAADAAIRERNIPMIEQMGLEMTDPELRTKLAQRIAVRVEGTYDGRMSPTYLMKGVWGDVLSLAKWNIEHANAWYTDIILPAREGNPGPLIWTLLAAAGITIPTKMALQEWIRKRRGNATLPEIKAAERTIQRDTGKEKTLVGKRVAWLTDMMNTAGIFGFLGQAANAVAQGASGNRQGASAIMIPFTEVFAEDLPKLIGDWQEAVDAGTPKDDATAKLGLEILRSMSQGFRAMYNQFPSRQEELDLAEANRDRAVFENMTEGKASQAIEANKLMNPKVQKFKNTYDPAVWEPLLKEVVSDIEEEFKDNQFLKLKKLRALKALSAREMPNEQVAFSRYRTYLEETLGKERADARVAQWAQHMKMNQVKGEQLRGIPEGVPVLK